MRDWQRQSLWHSSVLIACLAAGPLATTAQDQPVQTQPVQTQPPRQHAAQVPQDAEPIEHELLNGGALFRLGNQVFLQIDSHALTGQVQMPRMCASLRNVFWMSSDNSRRSNVDTQRQAPVAIELKPEPDYWTLSWKDAPVHASVLVLQFEQPPKLVDELQSLRSRGDGSFVLRADQARTAGEKIRYEPQTFKNTVGYWVGKQDSATWTIQVDEPGEFNVALLQGCGRGQGGSRAALQLLRDAKVVSELQFEVLETGHFQNFQWRTLEVLSINQAGAYQVRIVPIQIKRAALMDVRMVHLVRLPK